LARQPVRADDTEGIAVFPDVIVHRRGSPCNLVVIEAKKDHGDPAFDYQKLAAFLDESHLGYRYAFMLRFITHPAADVLIERVT
jgi:hypothetical protein